MLALVPLVAERRRTPGDDLLSALVHSGLDTDEVISTALLLLAAGHETTANLIGNGVLALRARPDLAGAAVDEILRYDTPVQLTRRVATSDRMLAGERVPRGTRAYVVLGAANRDGVADLRIDSGRPHLAFGHGPHYCAGAGLARLEVAETLRRLVSLLDTHWTATRRDTPTFRRLGTLRLEGSPGHETQCVDRTWARKAR